MEEEARLVTALRFFVESAPIRASCSYSGSVVCFHAFVSLTRHISAGGYAMGPQDLCTLQHAYQSFLACVSNEGSNSLRPHLPLFQGGVGLCAASANTFNQVIEIKHDAKVP